MLGKLILFIAIIGFCDVYLVVLSASYLGIWSTIGLCLLTAFIGSYLFKRQGLKVLLEFQQGMLNGIPPVDKLIDGVLILIGGVLLITPGYISDFIGLMLMVPMVRKLLKPLLIKFAKKNMQVSFHSTGFGGAGHFQQNANDKSSNEKEADIIDIK